MPTRWQKEYAEASSSSCPPLATVQDELQRILDSSDFKGTPRRRKLLRYLVEEMLAGRDRELKGYTIATVVFGRDDDFDPQTDPIVRLEARRLRHDLDGYYASSGRDNAIRISIPKGQYAPTIEWSEKDIGEVATTVSLQAEEVAATDPSPRAPLSLLARPRRLAWGVALVLALLVVSTGYVYWSRSGLARQESSRGPALAVMAFATDGSNAEHAALGSGFADQIMADLSRFSGYRLYLPQATTSGTMTSDPMEIGDRLGLTYIVDGSVHFDAGTDSIRISARLVEVDTRRIMWIGTFERPRSTRSLFAIRDEIASAVASALGQPYGVIRTEESNRLRDEAAPSTSSYECVLRAFAYRRSFTAAGHKAVMTCLEQAVLQDPKYADAWAMLGWLHMDAGRFGWAVDGDAWAAFQRGLSTVAHALSLDSNNITALKAQASIHHYMGNYPESERIQRRALELNPNDPDTLAQLGWRLAVRGRFEEGVPYLQQAIANTVNPPGWYRHLIAIDHYLKGRHEEMLETARASSIDGSSVSWSLVAIAEGAMGHKTAAAEALAKMAEISPMLYRDPAAAYRRHQAIDPIIVALVAGLRKAGWTEPDEITGLP